MHTIARGLLSREYDRYKKVIRLLCHTKQPFEIEYPVGEYVFDVALTHVKVLIEFDEPHHESSKQRDSDKQKHKAARAHGWRLKRIKHVEPSAIIPPRPLGVFLTRQLGIRVFKEKQQTYVLTCVNGHSMTDDNTYINQGRKTCRTCRKAARQRQVTAAHKNPRKPNPSKESLKKMLDEGMSRVAIGIEHGVSDTSVRKWIKNYGL